MSISSLADGSPPPKKNQSAGASTIGIGWDMDMDNPVKTCPSPISVTVAKLVVLGQIVWT